MADEAHLSDGGSPTPAKRKKVSNSSRGVANLTPDQLARKRANDREAQRAIRERTRNQIDTLNARIKDLESAQPYHDLQSALRQRDAALAENEGIRRKLATVIGILQPLAGSTSGLNELAAAAERIPLQDHTDNGSYTASLLASGQGQQADDSSAQHTTNGRDWQGAEAPGPDERGWPSGGSGWEPARDNLDPNLQLSQSDERLGVDFLLDHTQRAALQNGVAAAKSQSSPTLEGHDRSVQDDALSDAWETPPKFTSATCSLDDTILDFIAERVRRPQAGSPITSLAGYKYPNLDSIADPLFINTTCETSRVITGVVCVLPGVSNTPEKVALVYIMFLFMRWLIEPTPEAYQLMPQWLRPNPDQISAPYPHWITYVPWPGLRDRLVSSQSAPAFEHMFTSFTSTLSVNWPYEPKDCLIRNPSYRPHKKMPTLPGEPEGDAATPSTQWLINPVFETHLRDLNNWSLGTSFAESFPDFADTVRIREG